MAGFFHISDEVGCSMSSSDFWNIVTMARDRFHAGEETVVSELYEYFDASGDCLMILKNKNSSTFNSFCRAVFSALQDEELLAEIHPLSAKELRAKLKEDPRFDPAILLKTS